MYTYTDVYMDIIDTQCFKVLNYLLYYSPTSTNYSPIRLLTRIFINKLYVPRGTLIVAAQNLRKLLDLMGKRITQTKNSGCFIMLCIFKDIDYKVRQYWIINYIRKDKIYSYTRSRIYVCIHICVYILYYI